MNLNDKKLKVNNLQDVENSGFNKSPLYTEKMRKSYGDADFSIDYANTLSINNNDSISVGTLEDKSIEFLIALDKKLSEPNLVLDKLTFTVFNKTGKIIDDYSLNIGNYFDSDEDLKKRHPNPFHYQLYKADLDNLRKKISLTQDDLESGYKVIIIKTDNARQMLEDVKKLTNFKEFSLKEENKTTISNKGKSFKI